RRRSIRSDSFSARLSVETCRASFMWTHHLVLGFTININIKELTGVKAFVRSTRWKRSTREPIENHCGLRGNSGEHLFIGNSAHCAQLLGNHCPPWVKSGAVKLKA